MVKKILKATHEGPLKIGDFEIASAVLNDENRTRVLTQTDFLSALGRAGRGIRRSKDDVAKLPPFLAAKNLQPFIDKALGDVAMPIEFTPIKGGRAYGYDARLLPRICGVFLDARDADALLKPQLPTAVRAEVLTRGLAETGIIALVDEATGYQYDRARYALEEILEQFISKELMVWAKRFPDEFYVQLFRLKKWQPSKIAHRRPAIVGKLTNDIVYARLAPGVKDELHRITPRGKKGKLKGHLHRRLTEDVGHPALRAHLHAVIALMKVSSNWRQFMDRLNEVFPVWGKTMSLPLTTDDSGEPEPLKFPKGTKPQDALKAAMGVDPEKVKMREKKRKGRRE